MPVFDKLNVNVRLVYRLLTAFGLEEVLKLKEKNELLAVSDSSDSNFKYLSMDLQNVFNHFGDESFLTQDHMLANYISVAILILLLQRQGILQKNDSKTRSCIISFINNMLISLPSNVHGIGEMNYSRDADNVNSKDEKIVGKLKSFGIGLYNTLSLMNHSCIPNFVRLNQGKQVIAIASRLIMEGEEINENYGVSSVVEHSKQFRQEMLSKKYGFLCFCRSCQSDDADNDDQKTVDNNTNDDLRLFEDLHAAMVDRCWKKWGNKRNLFI